MFRSRHPLAWAAALLAVAGGLALLGYWTARRSVQSVVPGEVYRSGQPTPAQLAALRDRGVKTVINLRGENPNEAWYREEVDTAARLGLELHSIRFQGRDAPPRPELLRLLDLMETAERPILLHCYDGLDRTGWAAALALALDGASIDEAQRQLSPFRGHFCRPDECHFERFFEEYRAALRRDGREHSAATFRAWLRDYRPGPYAAEVELLEEPPSSARPGDALLVRARVANRSRSPWLTRSVEHPVRLGARFIGPFSAAPPDPLAIFRTPNGPARDLARAEFSPPEIRPDDVVELDMPIDLPDEPGLYFIHVDLVEEHVHWFSDLGDPGVVFPLTVEVDQPQMAQASVE